MTHHAKRSLINDYVRLAITAAAVFVAAYLFLSNTTDRSAMTSEARFADSTESGLVVVPASGVSETSYTGAYTGTYTGTYTGAYTGTYTGTYTSTYTGTYTGAYTGAYTGSYGGAGGAVTGSYTPVTGSYTPSGTCWDGSAPDGAGNCPACPNGYTAGPNNTCIPPDNNPQFIGFPTTQGFNASGHLEVRPSLVRSGDPTRVYWNVQNVADCTVRGSNGDGSASSVTGAWNTLGSGAGGKVTSPITSRTDYTLFCHSLTGATPSTITETRTVNVIPSWFEPSGNN